MRFLPESNLLYEKIVAEILVISYLLERQFYADKLAPFIVR
jgi:hypothetical protein